MSERDDKNSKPPAGRETKKGPAPDAAKSDDCRCKETANMDPRQLLGLMWSDLAFWKKPKK